MCASNLVGGRTRSCGCDRLASISRKLKKERRVKDHPLYAIWEGMRARCNNPARREYENYGGRGVSVCERWDSFESFVEDMGDRPSLDHTLDRKDNDGDYEPGNCRWATKQDQARNRRSNRVLVVRGVSQVITDWARQMGLSVSTIRARKELGWSDERAVMEPVR